MNTSDALFAAAELIRKHGWGTGPETWSKDAGRGLCIEGAIAAALNIDLEVDECARPQNLAPLWNCPAYQAVRTYLNVRDPWRWNDIHAKDTDEVIEVLERVGLIEAVREGAPLSVLEGVELPDVTS